MIGTTEAVLLPAFKISHTASGVVKQEEGEAMDFLKGKLSEEQVKGATEQAKTHAGSVSRWCMPRRLPGWRSGKGAWPICVGIRAKSARVEPQAGKGLGGRWGGMACMAARRLRRGR